MKQPLDIVIIDNARRPTHKVPVVPCRSALAQLRVRRNDLDRLDAFAKRAGVSKATASRFFNGGHQLRMDTARRILKALGLRLDQVAVPIEVIESATSG